MQFPYQLIDLTHALESTIPSWNGGCGFNHELQMDYANCQNEDKFRVMKLSMDAGIGTHMDAPSHCVPGGKGIHEFNVNDLCMPCVVIDVSSKAHQHYRVSAKDISDFEDLYGPISQDTCVMIKTGN
ncbi:MAG: Kynurenine formamidase [Legionella sp.]|uniref:cyclase family protein n=1 Tax=Legionella sp. TaxID=459 RepID=UPI003D0AD07D